MSVPFRWRMILVWRIWRRTWYDEGLRLWQIWRRTWYDEGSRYDESRYDGGWRKIWGMTNMTKDPGRPMTKYSSMTKDPCMTNPGMTKMTNDLGMNMMIWRILECLRLAISFSQSVRSPRLPGQLKTLLSRPSLYTVRRPRSANQRLRISTRHLADQLAIASGIDASYWLLFPERDKILEVCGYAILNYIRGKDAF